LSSVTLYDRYSGATTYFRPIIAFVEGFVVYQASSHILCFKSHSKVERLDLFSAFYNTKGGLEILKRI
jgi:hypothetical protein